MSRPGLRDVRRGGGTMHGKRNAAFGLALLLCGVMADGFLDSAAAQTKPEGEMRWALYVTLSSVWFDPAEVVGVITPFLVAASAPLDRPLPRGDARATTRDSPRQPASWSLDGVRPHR